MSENKSVDELIDLIFYTTKLIKEKVKNQAQKHQLPFMHIGILKFIAEKGEPTMKELAEQLCITAPSATSVVEGLIKSGYIERVLDKKDRRIVRITLTQSGKKELELILKSVKRKMSEMLDVLSEKEKTSLHGIFKNLSKNLNN